MTLAAWYDGHLDTPVTVTNATELDIVLDAVTAANARQLVQLIPHGDTTKPDLTVGLHEDRGTLRYASHDVECYSTGGTFALPDGWDELLYYLGSAEFEYPDDAEIAAKDVREAAHEFLRTAGERPAGVEWTCE
ncbi:Imm1 family immunity protein [Amycolatopsis sp. cg5]|uniref:Imm1 family immunity protein n=1 Tax=Amycolatopsis sp. cg5 TaxID=3238802 RepID=UPI00352352C6